MKRLVICLLIFLGVTNYSVNAQEKKDFRFTIKTNPLSALGGPMFVFFVPITGEYKVLFEARTAKRQSIETGISYLGPSALINLDKITSSDSSDVTGLRTTGFRAQLCYKFFLTKESAPEGFYVAPHFSYATARLENKDKEDQYFGVTKMNMDVLLGYQLITSGGFALNVFTGLGLKLRNYSFSEGSESIFNFKTGDDVAPAVAFGFSFGFAF
jgi:hypothetical protein